MNSTTQHLRLINQIRLFSLGVLLLNLLALLALDSPVYASHSLPPVAFLVLYFGLTLLRLRSKQPVETSELTIQLAMDIVLLSIFFYHTGGAANPAIGYLLVPVLMGVVVLPLVMMWSLAGLASACYSFLMIQHSHTPFSHLSETTQLQLYQMGYWLIFILIAWVMGSLIHRLVKQQRDQWYELEKARQHLSKQEQQTALGTQAALVAHEMGTPLSSVQILLSELQATHSDPELQTDLAALQQQIQLCQNSLQTLKRAPSEAQYLPVNVFLSKLADRWQLIHPDHNLPRLTVNSTAEVLVSKAVEHAIINLLDNALEAHQDLFHWQARSTSEGLHLDIENDDSGRDKNISLGLGVLLSEETFAHENIQYNMTLKDFGGRHIELVIPYH